MCAQRVVESKSKVVHVPTVKKAPPKKAIQHGVQVKTVAPTISKHTVVEVKPTVKKVERVEKVAKKSLPRSETPKAKYGSTIGDAVDKMKRMADSMAQKANVAIENARTGKISVGEAKKAIEQDKNTFNRAAAKVAKEVKEEFSRSGIKLTDKDALATIVKSTDTNIVDANQDNPIITKAQEILNTPIEAKVSEQVQAVERQVDGGGGGSGYSPVSDDRPKEAEETREESPPASEVKPSNTKYWIFGGVAAIAAIGGYIVYKKRSKK